MYAGVYAFGRRIRWHLSSRAHPRFRSDSRATIHQQRSSIGANANRTIRPKHPDCVQPLLNLHAEPSGSRILNRTDLVRKPEIAEKWNHLLSLRQKAAV